MKIAICGLVSSENLGEQFISKSLAWIIEDRMRAHGYQGELKCIEVDIEAKQPAQRAYHGFVDARRQTWIGYRSIGIPADILYTGLKKVAEKLPTRVLRNGVHRFRHFIWLTGWNQKRRVSRYLSEQFSDVDAIVIDGAGLLEYSKNEYQEYLLLISELGQKLGVPVVCNAIGKAGRIDERDYRYSTLQRCFSYPCMKYVSARDSVEIVQKCAGERFQVKLLADAAFCLDSARGIHADPESRTVGIGLIRGSALSAYGMQFSKNDLVQLFCDLAEELRQRGYEFRFFTNGMEDDELIGRMVIEKAGLPADCLVPRPTDPDVLLQTISSFAGLITFRMHSSIAAFTMGIPSVVLSWNQKVDQYLEMVGYPERAVPLEKFRADYIVDQYEKALQEGISDDCIARMKALAMQSVEEYISYLLDTQKGS